jgi:hypothetical protein
MKKRNRGQVSVFLGMSLLVIISLLAFVINVGLFVKAKINLQNAVDAAAYAGAAAQARQLTNIGYLNYELRNNYKEWLFKYYVVGQASNDNATAGGPAGETKEFRPLSIQDDLDRNPDAWDKFNIPRVCINLGDKNICRVYGVPGIPRFEASGLPVISELTNEFTNAAVAAKSANCSTRSNLNFSTTLTWTYGSGDGVSIGTELNLMNDRVGVWPKAVELGIRMRNLEAIVNRPPIKGICRSPGGSGCTIGVNDLLAQAGNTPINERPVNAFMSAYRNLGGGGENINQGADHLSMKNTLVLTELTPTAFPFTQNKGLSGFLIPDNSTIVGSQYTTKHYLDLKAIPINYIIFFTTFVTTSGDFGGGVSSEGACSSSITGIPVPFLITGFIKNPRVLTYYAVKAEAKYTGLFFPFTKTQGLTLKAYAAAKPFGGRIGPALFKIDGDAIKSRKEVKRSAAYAGGVKKNSGTDGFTAGMPIPFPDGSNSVFIESNTDIIGGTPDDDNRESIKFATPNMVYDIIGNMAPHITNSLMIVDQKTTNPDHIATGPVNTTMSDRSGLYDHDQYSAFKNNLIGLTTDGINKSIIKLKKPTVYEALNYLVPSAQALGEKVATVQGVGNPNFSGSTIYNLFAPFCGDNYLISCKAADVSPIIEKYLAALEKPVTDFLEGLSQVSKKMMDDASSVAADPDNYKNAAFGIHPGPAGTPLMSPSAYAAITDCQTNEQAKSLANKFNFFFGKEDNDPACGIVPLRKAVAEFLDRNMSGSAGDTFKNFVTGLDYVKPDNENIIYSAFRPDQRYDVDLSSGEAIHPITGQKFGANAMRNFYSTKFIAINKLFTSGSQDGDYGKFFLYNDKLQSATATESGYQYEKETDVISGGASGFYNKLKASELSEFVPMDTVF